jgi:hypothetical protein
VSTRPQGGRRVQLKLSGPVARLIALPDGRVTRAASADVGCRGANPHALLPQPRFAMSGRPASRLRGREAMLRRLQAFLVLGGLVVAVPAAAQEPMDEPESEEGG